MDLGEAVRFNSFSVGGIIGSGWMAAVGSGGAMGVRKAVGRVNSYRSIVMKPDAIWFRSLSRPERRAWPMVLSA